MSAFGKLQRVIAILVLALAQHCCTPRAEAQTVTTLEISLYGLGNGFNFPFLIDMSQSEAYVWRDGAWSAMAFHSSESLGGTKAAYHWRGPLAGANNGGVVLAFFDVWARGMTVMPPGVEQLHPSVWRRCRIVIKQDPFSGDVAKSSTSTTVAEVGFDVDLFMSSQTRGDVTNVDPITFTMTTGTSSPTGGGTYVGVCNPEHPNYDPLLCDQDCDGTMDFWQNESEGGNFRPCMWDSDCDGIPDDQDPDSVDFGEPCFLGAGDVYIGCPDIHCGWRNDGSNCCGETPDPDPDPDPPPGPGYPGGPPGPGEPPINDPGVIPPSPPGEPITEPGPPPSPPGPGYPIDPPPQPPLEDACCQAIVYWLKYNNQRLYNIEAQTNETRMNTWVTADAMRKFREFDFTNFRVNQYQQMGYVIGYLDDLVEGMQGEAGEAPEWETDFETRIDDALYGSWTEIPGYQAHDWDIDGAAIEGATLEEGLDDRVFGSGGLFDEERLGNLSLLDHVPTSITAETEPPLWEFSIPIGAYLSSYGLGSWPDMNVEIDWAFWTPYRFIVKVLFMFSTSIWALGYVWGQMRKQ